MAFTAYHNVTGSSGVTVELIQPEDNTNGISSILLSNIHASASATVDLFIQDASTNTKYHLLYNVSLPLGASLLLDDSDMLSFNNRPGGYSLNLKMGSTSDLINVLIKK